MQVSEFRLRPTQKLGDGPSNPSLTNPPGDSAAGSSLRAALPDFTRTTFKTVVSMNFVKRTNLLVNWYRTESE